MKTIKVSKETKKSLLGLKITNVGDDYIELEGGIRVYIDEAEIEMLGMLNDLSESQNHKNQKP